MKSNENLNYKINPDKRYSRFDGIKYINCEVIIDRRYVESMNPEQEVEDETWRDLPGYEFLEVSSWGNIRRKSHTISYYRSDYKRYINRNLDQIVYSVHAKEEGYLECISSYGNIACHRAVASAFIGEPADGSMYEVDHIDFNTNNAYYKNLQYLTPEDNKLKSIDNVKASNGRPIVELKSGVKYNTLNDLADKYGSMKGAVLQCIGTALSEQIHYCKKYDILVYYASDLPKDISDFSIDEREALLHSARIKCIRSHKAQGIRCLTDGKFYPSAQYAEKQLNIPSGTIYEAIRERAGVLKKYGLKFIKINMNDVLDSEIDFYMDHYLFSFSTISGGNHKESGDSI